MQGKERYKVAPHAGAWIETRQCFDTENKVVAFCADILREQGVPESETREEPSNLEIRNRRLMDKLENAEARLAYIKNILVRKAWFGGT